MANRAAARCVQVAANAGVGCAGGGSNGHATAPRIVLSIGSVGCIRSVWCVASSSSPSTSASATTTAAASSIGAARIPYVLVPVDGVGLDVEAILFVGAVGVAVDLVAGGRDARVVRRVLCGALQMVVGVGRHAQRQWEASVCGRRGAGRCLIVVTACAHRHARRLVRMAIEAAGLLEVRVHVAVVLAAAGGENFGGFYKQLQQLLKVTARAALATLEANNSKLIHNCLLF